MGDVLKKHLSNHITISASHLNITCFPGDRYKSDGEDHNASDSESNDEDPDFLVAEGEENANATYDMGHRAKKRLRRWRSLDTPEQRSEKVKISVCLI